MQENGNAAIEELADGSKTSAPDDGKPSIFIPKNLAFTSTEAESL